MTRAQQLAAEAIRAMDRAGADNAAIPVRGVARRTLAALKADRRFEKVSGGFLGYVYFQKAKVSP